MQTFELLQTDKFIEKNNDLWLDVAGISISQIFNLSSKYITDKEIRILKSKNRHIKNNGYETDYYAWVESIRNKAFEKCNDCHFVRKYKGVDIYEVDVEIAGYSETKKGDTIFATVRIYQGWENDFVSRIIA